ncbi:MAG: hypothetical protein QW228_03120 [Candidatus Aenigmatarchaeota archaeon]
MKKRIETGRKLFGQDFWRMSANLKIYDLRQYILQLRRKKRKRTLKNWLEKVKFLDSDAIWSVWKPQRTNDD